MAADEDYTAPIFECPACGENITPAELYTCDGCGMLGCENDIDIAYFLCEACMDEDDEWLVDEEA